MNPRRVLLIALVALPTSLPIHAEESSSAGSHLAPAAPATAAPAAAGVARRPTPMVADILAAIDEQRGVLRALKARLSKTQDRREVIEIHRAISTAKLETEVRLLRIQAGYARREGRLEAATHLEAAITAMSAAPVAREAAPARAQAR
jgi:hypothetical protein